MSVRFLFNRLTMPSTVHTEGLKSKNQVHRYILHGTSIGSADGNPLYTSAVFFFVTAVYFLNSSLTQGTKVTQHNVIFFQTFLSFLLFFFRTLLIHI